MAIAERAATATHFIDGEETPSASGRTFAAVDPSSADEIGRVAFGEAEDVDRAVQSGKRAFESGVWSKAAPGERARIMRQLADLIRENADRIGRDRIASTPASRSRRRRARSCCAADFLTYFAGHAELPNGRTHPADAGYFVYSVREPYGVVGAISPWNYPFLLAAWKTAPALAAGNSVVLKMAEQSPLSTSELAKLTIEAGMPPGRVQRRPWRRAHDRRGARRPPDVPKLTFTGSTATGQAILRSAAEHIKSVHLELGGKTPNIVFADADLDQAIAGSLFTAFYNTGQICTSGSRLLVQKSDADDVVEAFVERARNDQGRRPGRSGDPARAVDLATSSTRGSPATSRRASAVAPRSRSAGPRRGRTRAATSSSPRSSSTSRPTCGSPRRRSSGPSCRS